MMVLKCDFDHCQILVATLTVMLFAYLTTDCTATEIIRLVTEESVMEETVNALLLSALDSFLHQIFDCQFAFLLQGFSKAGGNFFLNDIASIKFINGISTQIQSID